MFLKFDLFFFSNFLFRVLCVCISWHDIALKNYIENRAQLTHLVGYVCVRLSVCVCVSVCACKAVKLFDDKQKTITTIA